MSQIHIESPVNVDATSATLTVDLAALRANWRFLANKASYAECAAVIKANAYGIGLKEAAQALTAEGCRTFFVARLSEGRDARIIAPNATIYVLDGAPASALSILKDYNLRPVLNSLEDIAYWRARGPAALHFDTGMNRLGLAPEHMDEALELLGAPPALLMSHLSCAEQAASTENDRQVALFHQLRDRAPQIPASLSSSSGIFLPSKPWFELVRPGYALYGGNPTPDEENPMRSVVSVYAPILQIRTVNPGDRVGYNGIWTAERPSAIIILAAGYADGVPRAASHGDARKSIDVIAGGVRCPVIGRVSMDLMAVDATDAPPEAIRRNEAVEILGKTIGVDEVAERSGTIGYEILTRLGPRYRRVHYDDALRS